MKPMLVADLLCGAGGSSTGCVRALAELGLGMELVCVNHWGVAIETHKQNHPEARHYCEDIATVRPHLLVPEGYLDLLMASPSCTHHSLARGGKPTSDQQRSDPWHIITWLTELRVKRIIIENVWEFTGWGPVDPRTGKPIKSRKGEYFRQWIATLQGLGFVVEWRKLNAADYGDATTRQRFILMGRSDGKPIQWPVPTHRRREDGVLELFPTMKPWKAAREIIDWSIKGKSIYTRAKGLAPKTMLRILAGVEKHGWPRPYIVTLRNHMAARGIDLPLPTIAANGTHIGLAQPVLMNGRRGNEAKGVDEAPEPLVGGNRNNNVAKPTSEPLGTATTAPGGGLYLAEPLILRTDMHRADGACVTGEVEPFIATVAHGNEAGDPTADTRRVHSVEAPLGAIHAGGKNFAVVEPFVLSRHAEGAPRSVDEPTPTQVAKQSHLLVTSYYGASQNGAGCTSGDDPLPTVTVKDRFGMVVPVTHADGSNRARDIGEPLPTLTTANRGELAFIAAQHGEREGQAPRTHDLGQPAPTIAASGHVDLVEPDERTYDILFRMLEPHELAAAMGFNTEEAAYEFAGTKTEKIKQIGNAVSVAKMKACVGAIMADAAPKRAAARANDLDEAAA